ncbi:MAG: DUF1553 domain-containing protein [Leptospiraceae bacterium]|nr:DUF1553 domain-containing protein [Leptospiraceae bacterium]MCB1303425.1 DUF1553 domain-containing protein [Leptospiraceae bacterium]
MNTRNYAISLSIFFLGILTLSRSIQAEPLNPQTLDSLYDKLAGASVEPASPGIVLRRMSLHLRGTIPSIQELENYQSAANADPNMARLNFAVAFIRDPDFAHYWGTYFASLFREQTEGRGIKYGSYFQYLANSIHQNKPYDVLVTELLTASGSPDQNPAVNFIVREGGDPLQLAEYSGRLFYGKKLECARCHNHPFYSGYTRRDYYGLAAFFAQQYSTKNYDAKFKSITGLPYIPRNQLDGLPAPEKKKYENAWNQFYRDYWNKLSKEQKQAHQKGTDLTYEAVYSVPEMGLRFPISDNEPGGDLIKPVFPDGTEANIEPGADRRKILAAWFTDRKNDRFRKVLINRIWTRLMGWSFFTPMDDWNDKTEIRGEAILNHLDEVFVRQNYRIKDLILYIVSSRAYSRSMPLANSSDAKSDIRYFQAQRMDPDQLMNSLIKGSFAVTVSSINERRVALTLDRVDLSSVDLRGMGSLVGPKQQQRDFSNAAQVERPVRYNTFLAVFGAGPRVDIADDEATPTIEQVLTLLNGNLTNRLARDFAKKGSIIHQRFQADGQIKDAANTIFESLLSRKMSDPEWQKIESLTSTQLAGNKQDRFNQEAMQDLIWSIFNSQEFIHVN